MEKSVSIQLNGEQQKELSTALGFDFDRVTVRATYVLQDEAGAKGKGEVIATLEQAPGPGQVWVVDGVQVVPQSGGQEMSFQFDLSAVTGGGPKGNPSDKDHMAGRRS